MIAEKIVTQIEVSEIKMGKEYKALISIRNKKLYLIVKFINTLDHFIQNLSSFKNIDLLREQISICLPESSEENELLDQEFSFFLTLSLELIIDFYKDPRISNLKNNSMMNNLPIFGMESSQSLSGTKSFTMNEDLEMLFSKSKLDILSSIL